MGEQRLRTLAVRLAAEDAAAGRHAHHQRRGEVAVRAVAQAGGLRHDLVVGRIHVIGELDLDAGPQAIGRHADGDADDAELADRRVEAAVGAVFLLQALGAAEHAAEIAHVLAEHDDVLVARHRHVHRVADRLDHGPARHRSGLRLLLRIRHGTSRFDDRRDTIRRVEDSSRTRRDTHALPDREPPARSYATYERARS